MLRSMRSRIAVILSAGALTGALAAGTAEAQPVVTGGLVNVTVTNVLNNNQVNVQVPIGVAANVCGVNAAVIAANFRQTTDPVCNAGVSSNLPVAFQP